MDEIKFSKRLAKKRLKRRRKLYNRVKCHGNKQQCIKNEPKKEVKKATPQVSSPTAVETKTWKDWFSKIKTRVLSMIGFTSKEQRRE